MLHFIAYSFKYKKCQITFLVQHLIVFLFLVCLTNLYLAFICHTYLFFSHKQRFMTKQTFFQTDSGKSKPCFQKTYLSINNSHKVRILVALTTLLQNFFCRRVVNAIFFSLKRVSPKQGEFFIYTPQLSFKKARLLYEVESISEGGKRIWTLLKSVDQYNTQN